MRLDHSETPGSGAAGGSGYGLKVFCNAEFISGVDFLFELSSFDDILATHRFDLIITGEGCLDEQSTRGKLINGVIKRSLPFPVKVMAICGKLDLDEFEWRAMGLHYATAIAEGVSKEESIANASLYVEQIAYNLLDKI